MIENPKQQATSKNHLGVVQQSSNQSYRSPHRGWMELSMVPSHLFVSTAPPTWEDHFFGVDRSALLGVKNQFVLWDGSSRGPCANMGLGGAYGYIILYNSMVRQLLLLVGYWLVVCYMRRANSQERWLLETDTRTSLDHYVSFLGILKVIQPFINHWSTLNSQLFATSLSAVINHDQALSVS